jgi:8-oxo-dGTP pyrophosphatase MutT (NUDIX family)
LDKEKKHWEILSSEPGFKGNWINLDVDRILLPDGKQIEFEALKFYRAGVGIVAENEKNEIILVKSYRYVSDTFGWEVPAGTVPVDQHHKDCIIQELKEEAGCVPGNSGLEYLGYFYPVIGCSNQIFHCYHAKNVRQISAHTDTNEILETKWFSHSEIREMISKNEIIDGFTLTLLLRVFLQ